MTLTQDEITKLFREHYQKNKVEKLAKRKNCFVTHKETYEVKFIPISEEQNYLANGYIRGKKNFSKVNKSIYRKHLLEKFTNKLIPKVLDRKESLEIRRKEYLKNRKKNLAQEKVILNMMKKPIHQLLNESADRIGVKFDVFGALAEDVKYRMTKNKF